MPFKPGSPKPAGSGRRRKETSQAPTILLENWPIDRLKPYERNPRKNDKAVARMVASIREYGFAVPILARSSGEVIDGHLRLKAAIEMKLQTVPVIICDSWTEAQVKAFRLLANRSVNWADWDMEALALEFAELKKLEFSLVLTGFDTREIDALTMSPVAAEDVVPPVPAVPVTQPGDLWLLGSHRLLCGDSSDPANIARLLAGSAPGIMVTDPPYGVKYDPKWRLESGINKIHQQRAEGIVSNDDTADWTPVWKLFTGAVAYVWHSGLFSGVVAQSLKSAGFALRSQIIWSKPSLVIGRGHYHWQHEPCYYAARSAAGWNGDRKQSTVWSIANMHATQGDVDDGKTNHSTQKPVECMRRPILNHTRPGEGVFDPFLGSGTTLIAAELTGRVCYGQEIDPAYCDVIVTRWEKLTGKKAVRERQEGSEAQEVREAQPVLEAVSA